MPKINAFTLLEMLLALVVIAVTSVSVSRAISGVAGQTYTLERRTMAHWVGQNQLNQLRISLRQEARPLPVGKDTTRISMGLRDWEVQTSIISTDSERLRRVEVDVFELQDGERVGPFDRSIAFMGGS